MNGDGALTEAESILLEHHPEHYRAALFSPAAQRRALTGLLTCIAEIRAIPLHGRQPQIATAKLGWWREEFARLASGTPRHPGARCLRDHRAVHGHPAWLALIEAVAHDVRYDAYPGDTELTDLARRLGSAETALLATFDPSSGDPDLQVLITSAAWTVALGPHAQRGRVYLPLDRLHAAGIAPSALQGPYPDEDLRTLLQSEVDGLVHALTGRLDAAAGTRAQRVLGAQYLARLTRLRNRGCRAWRHATVPAWRQLFTAWRAARR